MRPVFASLLVLAAISLQGCVAAVIPLAAAGVLGKKEIDEDKPDAAEQGIATAQVETAESIVAPAQPPAEGDAVADTTGSGHSYAPFAAYALDRQKARAAGNEIRSAVLVENVSLNDPRAIDCAQKPMAVIIDVDQEAVATSSISGLTDILQSLRTSDIRIAWVGNGTMEAIEAQLEGARLLDSTDIILPASEEGPRKQEQRTSFAVGHCVVAIAGDVQTDFDELFDYLNDPGYASKLDDFRGNGWFLVPSPLTRTGNAP